MANELARVSAASVPGLVERAGGAARFAWDEFFYAEHRNPHTQKAYQRAVRRFLAWVEKEGVELQAVTPRMVGDYLGEDLGGSPSKQNLHLAALRGFFGRLVQRHVCVLNPAATISPHSFLHVGLVHQFGDRFREFGFLVRLNINSSPSRRKPCLFQIEAHDGLCIGHVFHDLDPRGHIVQGAAEAPGDAPQVRPVRPVGGLGLRGPARDGEDC